MRKMEREGEKEQNKKKKGRKKEELLPPHSSSLFLINSLQDSCKGKITATNKMYKYNSPFDFFSFLCFLYNFARKRLLRRQVSTLFYRPLTVFLCLKEKNKLYPQLNGLFFHKLQISTNEEGEITQFE